MSFDSWSAFWHMGGHGVYVWSSYGMTFAVLLAMVWLPWRRHRRLLAEIARRERIEAQAEAASGSDSSGCEHSAMRASPGGEGADDK